MQNKWMMCILTSLCVFLGFALSINLLGVKQKSYTVRSGDVFYAEPAVTMAQTQSFPVGTSLRVTDSVELKQPTAVIAAKDVLVEAKDKTKYQLRSGAVYKLAEARLAQPNAPCVLEVETTKGQTARIEVEKSALLPVNEGTWLQVRSNDNKKAWVRIASQWY